MKKYVLPTYAVNIYLPERVAIPDETFDFTVEALYTFGEGVQGEATVNFYVYEWNWGGPFVEYPMEEQPMQAMPEPEPVPVPADAPARRKRQIARPMPIDYGWGNSIRKDLASFTFDIDSKAVTLPVKILEDLGITSEQTINAEVVFTEKLTGKIATATGSVYVAQYGYEMFITSSDFYEAGVPYPISIAVRKIGTGVPVSIFR